jgi:hypothetical protein
MRPPDGSRRSDRYLICFMSLLILIETTETLVNVYSPPESALSSESLLEHAVANPACIK